MNRSGLRVLIAFVALVLAGGQTTGQESGADTAPESDYRVGPGDVLEIEVYDDPDLSGLMTVQHGGEIPFPLLGDVKVSGLTAKEVRDTLTGLLAKDYLVDPQVVVKVKEHRSQWITLVGEVQRPGKYFLQGSKTLLELLTEAGGFTIQASGEVLVSRPEETGPTRVFLSPDQPSSQQKAALSLALRNGDIVTATATQFFYVSGEVKNPGSYPITPGLTVLKAISVAGGLTKFGSKGKVEILRKVSEKETDKIKVDLDDIQGGKRPDVPLLAEDIITVGKRLF